MGIGAKQEKGKPALLWKEMRKVWLPSSGTKMEKMYVEFSESVSAPNTEKEKFFKQTYKLRRSMDIN